MSIDWQYIDRVAAFNRWLKSVKLRAKRDVTRVYLAELARITAKSRRLSARRRPAIKHALDGVPHRRDRRRFDPGGGKRVSPEQPCPDNSHRDAGSRV